MHAGVRTSVHGTNIMHFLLTENIMLAHNYTDNPVATAAAAANAGTCLEDGGSYQLNIFDRVGDAVNQVSESEVFRFYYRCFE